MATTLNTNSNVTELFDETEGRLNALEEEIETLKKLVAQLIKQLAPELEV